MSDLKSYPEILESGEYTIHFDGQWSAGSTSLPYAAHYFQMYAQDGGKVEMKGPNGDVIFMNFEPNQ